LSGWFANARWFYGHVKIIFAISFVAAAVTWMFIRSPWPFVVTLKHIAAAPNCNAARAVGLAPARRGEPGYWSRHDADSDGIACEPWPRSR
jgi:hypothetical protein